MNRDLKKLGMKDEDKTLRGNEDQSQPEAFRTYEEYSEDYGAVLNRLKPDRTAVQSKIDEFPDWKLNAVLESGLNHGKQLSKRVRRKKASLWLLTALVSCALLLTASVRLSPAFANLLKEIPGFSGYVELFE